MENSDEADNIELQGIDFDLANTQSCNKLLKAVINCDERTVKKLLKRKWNPNSVDNVGRTALHLASRSASHCSIARLLIEHGAYPDHVTHSGVCALSLASYYGVDKTVRLLLENGASVKIRSSIQATPLHFACNGINVEVVRLLVEAGCSVNAADCDGVTPLMIAVKEMSHRSIISYLLERDADVMLKDWAEKTVFHHVCNSDDLDLFNILLAEYRGLSPVGDITDSGDWTLLMYAAQVGAVKIIDRLLQLGCDVSKRNSGGLLALHLAAHNSASCFESILNVTPVDVINSACRFQSEDISNSLPCLLIDIQCLEGLRLLFGKVGVSDEVLLCPIVWNKITSPPIPFSLSSHDSQFISELVDLYLDRNLPLDIVLNVSSLTETSTCIASLVKSHAFHSSQYKLDTCSCFALFTKLLKSNVSPDLCMFPNDLNNNLMLKYLCVSGSTDALSYILRYSNFCEPRLVLEGFSRYISNFKRDVERDAERSASAAASVIRFLCKLTLPWHVNESLSLLLNKNTAYLHLERIIEAFHIDSVEFPSLRFLSRSALREHLHSCVLKYDCTSIKMLTETGQAFRQSLVQLPLARTLMSYLVYDDLINQHSNSQ